MDLKKFKEDYDKYDLSQKKETVINMLKALLGKGDNFDNIYNFIIQNPNDVVYKNPGSNNINSKVIINTYRGSSVASGPGAQNSVGQVGGY